MTYSQTLVAASASFLAKRNFVLDRERIGMIPSEKFEPLLRSIWRSPIFGDAFPVDVSTRLREVLGQIKSVETSFLNGMNPILTRAMPKVAPAEVEKLVKSIGFKIVPFCSAIVAGDIGDMQQLQSAAMNISLIYWADHSMDKNDEATLAAVRLLGQGSASSSALTAEVRPAMIEARLTALRWIEREVERLSLPEDRETLLQCGIQETLHPEHRKRELNRLYGLEAESEFWAAHTQDLADTLLATAALPNIIATLYALVYRQHQSDLPNLAKVFGQTEIMELLQGPYNAAIRAFDDWKDRSRDSSHYPGWGEFNFNIFNQLEPGLLRAFLNRAGLNDEDKIASLINSFQADLEEDRAYIIKVFKDLLRDRFASLPASVWNEYRVFLTLAKRVMDASYVYCLEGI